MEISKFGENFSFENKNNNEKSNPIDQKDFFDLVLNSLKDKKLSESERITLNNYLTKIKNQENLLKMTKISEIGKVKQETKGELLFLKNSINSRNDLIKMVSEAKIFKEALNEIQNLSKKEIKNIQRLIGSDIDGNFGVETFITYKNHRLSENFSLTEIAKGREVGNDVNGFIQKLAKAEKFNAESLAIILGSELKPNDYVLIDDDNNIIISRGKGGENVLTFSDQPSMDNINVTALKDKNITLIKKYLNRLKEEDDKKDFIKNIKHNILIYKFREEAREIFTKTKNGKIELNFPSPLFEEIFTLNDLFGDLDSLKFNGKIYKNINGNFINDENHSLSFSDFKTKKVEFIENKKEENISKKTEEKIEVKDENNITKEEANKINENVEKLKNLTDEFGKWLNKEGKKYIYGAENSCGAACSRLINMFLRSKGIKGGMIINKFRHGTNFDNILNNEVSVSNPFIINKRIKITSKEKLKKYGIDINKTLNQKIKITKRKIDFPKDAKPGELLCYNHTGTGRRGTSSARKTYGHIEARCDSGYAFYKIVENAGGSASIPQNGSPERYRKITGFDGYAYSLNLA